MRLKRRKFFIGVENRVFQHNRPKAVHSFTLTQNIQAGLLDLFGCIWHAYLQIPLHLTDKKQAYLLVDEAV